MSAAEIQPGTRGYAEAGKCCDEAGWRLKTDGTPREPAEACKNHREKHAHPRTGADKPVSATRQGNKDKFAWFYDMLADPTVSIAAKVVGTGCCMKMAGCKGHFKTTRKAVANLCGISQATVRRGLADLIDKRYLDAELVDGAASTYHLIYPAQRYEEWLEAEQKYNCEIKRAEHQIREWLWAEKKWRDERQEKQFRQAVLVASYKRGATLDRARQIADRTVAKYRAEGVELDVERALAAIANTADDVLVPAPPAVETPPSGDPEADQKRADPGTPESRPRYAREPTPAHTRSHHQRR